LDWGDRHSPRAFEKRNDLGGLGALIDGVATCDRAFDAMAKVIAKHHCFDPRQRRAHCLKLGQHVDAIAVLADHPVDSADLTLDPAKPIEQFVTIRMFHMISPWSAGLDLCRVGV